VIAKAWRRILAQLPWPTANLTPLLTMMLLVGLMEYTRTGLYTVYLPQSLGPLVGLGAVGLAASLQYFADALARSLGGHLSERFGVRRVFPAVSLLGAAFVIYIIRTHSTPGLLLFSLAYGLAIAPLWPTFLTYSTGAANSGEDGHAVGITLTLVAPFIGLGSLLTSYLFDHSPALAAASLTVVQVLFAAVGVGLIPLIFRSVPPPRVVDYARFPWRKIAFLAPGALTQMLALGLLTPVIFPFFKERGFDTTSLVIALVVGGGLEVLLISPVGRYIDRRGPGRGFVFGLGIAALALFSFSTVHSLVGLIAVAALAGALQAVLIPSWGGLVSRSLPSEFKASAWGALMSLEGLGFAIGPVIGGYSWQLLGHSAPFYVGAALYAAVALFYLTQLRKL